MRSAHAEAGNESFLWRRIEAGGSIVLPLPFYFTGGERSTVQDGRGSPKQGGLERSGKGEGLGSDPMA